MLKNSMFKNLRILKNILFYIIWHPSCSRRLYCNIAVEGLWLPFKLSLGYNTKEYSLSNRNFGARCAKCCRSIGAADWVRRARDRVYHLACFSCDTCKRQLSTGEEFALHESRVLCKQHYLESIEGGCSSNDESEGGCRNKCKRVRTTFSDEQLQVLQANFQLDSNPDGQDLERIAQITGLSKRVTQVWFQNNRARQKKYMMHGKRHHSPHTQLEHPSELCIASCNLFKITSIHLYMTFLSMIVKTATCVVDSIMGVPVTLTLFTFG
ncbi:unnamed protein product, partial [Meganyctiphanes norvegica]